MMRYVTTAFIIVAWALIVYAVSLLFFGCTAASYERDAAQAAAAKGCYCSATECKKVVSAVGVAATVAAERETLKAVQVTRR